MWVILNALLSFKYLTGWFSQYHPLIQQNKHFCSCWRLMCSPTTAWIGKYLHVDLSQVVIWCIPSYRSSPSPEVHQQVQVHPWSSSWSINPQMPQYCPIAIEGCHSWRGDDGWSSWEPLVLLYPPCLIYCQHTRTSANYLFVYRLYRLPQIHSPTALTALLMPLHFFVHFFDILFWYTFLVHFCTLSDTLFIKLFVRLFIHLWVHFGKTFDILFNALFKHFPRHFSENSLYTPCIYICM